MRVVTVVGARPQFIKAAVVSRELRINNEEIIVHTGQHYDYNMSEIFFKEMNIPRPDYNLGINGGTHGKMTGEMLIAIENVLMEEKPDMVLLYGDTNSTMAGAIDAAKLHIPVCHVEAGNRLGTLNNPEEINRIITDHISSILCCCTISARNSLVNEGIGDKAFIVGDPMYDAFKYYTNSVGEKIPEKLIDINGNMVNLPKEFYYLTCHREENTTDDSTLLEILSAMELLDARCVYPVHPRNRDRIRGLLQNNNRFRNTIFCNPVGYLMSIYLVNHAKKIITDSGGLQREAYFAKKQCVTIFDYIVWPETMINNRNQLSKPSREEILNKLSINVSFDNNDTQFGDGHSAKKIVSLLENGSKE